MFENPFNITKALAKIDDTIGVIYIGKNELRDEEISLINYLANGQLSEAFWQSEKYPKHIFTEQFASTILITITENQDIDVFSKDFANGRRISSLQELLAN